MIQRIPPQNIEAEQAVLGSLILIPEAFDEVRLHVSADDFYRPEHGVIFAHLSPCSDLVVLARDLKESGKLDMIGGPAYLASLTDTVPSATMAVRYAKMVRQESKKRQFISRAARMIDSCYSGGDFDCIVADLESEAFSLSEGLAVEESRHIGDIVRDEAQRVYRIQSGSEEPGIMTGFFDLDFMTSGLHPGDLIVLAGRPSMGKSALAFGILNNIGRKGVPCGAFSLEMSAQMNGQRTLSAFAGINSKLLHTRGQVRDEHWDRINSAVKSIDRMPVFIDCSGGLHVAEIRSRARRMARKHGVKVIVADYLQMIAGEGKSREQEVAHVSRELKAMAKELAVPVIAVAQLNRAAETKADKRPALSELRESGQIEQDADVVMLVYRDEYYTKDNCREKGVAEVDIAKQRNGPTGVVKLAWHSHTATFHSLETYHSGARA